MNEFFREVDEDFRRDQVAQFWKRWGGLVIGAVVIVVIGVAGWRYWDYLETTRAQESAARFYEAQQQIEQTNVAAGQGLLEELAATGRGGYTILARFRLAASQGQQNPDAGALAYDALADDANVPENFRNLARLRAALLRLDTQYETAAAQLQSLAAPDNPYRHSAREALGLAALKRGDYEAAGSWFDQLAMDADTPQALRGRLEIYSALVAAGPLQPTQ
jgi:hypothetical protein